VEGVLPHNSNVVFDDGGNDVAAGCSLASASEFGESKLPKTSLHNPGTFRRRIFRCMVYFLCFGCFGATLASSFRIFEKGPFVEHRDSRFSVHRCWFISNVSI
jgi:hypothetical protein